jgi:hypothetical protein
MTRQRNKSSLKKLSPTLIGTIVVALITCISTVLAAFITGFFGYLKDKPVEPIATASAFPTFIPAVVTPTEELIHWQDLLSIYRDSSCFANYVPESMFGGQDKISWLRENYAPYYHNESLMYAPFIYGGDVNDFVAIYYSITNTNSDNNWIQISKKITVSVEYVDEAPSNADVTIPASGCGAGANYIDFPNTPLKNDFPQYSVNIEAQDNAQYYKLAPGEFEIFVLGFKCQQPGIYAIAVNLPVVYLGSSGNVIYSSTPEIVCPTIATVYPWDLRIDESVEFAEGPAQEFKWTGTKYEPVIP